MINTRILTRLAIVLGTLVLAVAPASAATYYVSVTGNDGNPGTLTRPWRTITKSANTMVAGDTVNVRNGVYFEQVIVRTSGTPGRPITFQAYPGEHPVVDGTSVLLPDAEEFLWFMPGDTSYITIDGFEIRNSRRFGVGVSRGVHITIQNNSIHDTGTELAALGDDGTHGAHGGGIWFGSGHDVQYYGVIRNNSIYNTFNGGITLWDCHSGYFLIEGNSIHDWQGIGNWDAIEAHGTPYVVVKNNTIFNAGAFDGADYLDSGSQTGSIIEEFTHHVVYEGNLIYMGTATHTNYVKLNKSPHRCIIRRNVLYQVGMTFYTKPFTDFSVHHNTIVGGSNTDLMLWQKDEPSIPWSGITLKNNIFAFSDGYLIQHSPDALDGSYTNIRMDHNVYRFSSKGLIWAMANTGEALYQTEQPGATGLAAFNQWRLVTGQEPSGGTRTEQSLAQLFMDVANKNFRLLSGSAAIDAGAPLTVTTSAGSGTVVGVVESFHFTDGYGLTPGDLITVGSSIARVLHVNETANTLTLDRAVSWVSGAPVSLPYVGAAPDAGAFEFGVPVGPPTTPTNLRIVH